MKSIYILQHLAGGRVIATLARERLDRGGYYEMVNVRGGEGGMPWCEDFEIDGSHHHPVWAAPFQACIRHGWIEPFACYLRGDLVYRITDQGRAELARSL